MKKLIASLILFAVIGAGATVTGKRDIAPGEMIKSGEEV